MNWTLQVDEGRTETVPNSRELRQRLAALHERAKQAPFFAVLNAPDGSSLAIGLGQSLSVLSHTEAGGWPARHVLGDATNEGLVHYTFLGHFSEMPAQYAIPVQQAIDAAIEFFESGKPTERLVWESD